jgi:hypothetical protein
MIRRETAFSILELTIALAIVMLVLFSAINFFIVSVKQYKVQTKITETNLEGILGLEVLRKDVESLGFGLPWNNLTGYTEIAAGPAALLALNDSPNAPRAVVSVDGAAFTFNNSDYLAIKAANVGMGEAAGKWTHLTQANVKRPWTPASENLQNNDYVIVLAIGSTDTNRRSLVNPGTFYTQFNNTAGYVPTEPYSANIVYGIDNVAPFRPFNRADYFLDNTSVPRHCAPGTGVLVKAVVPQTATGSNPTLLPLLDCVADMKVVYGLDNNADGIVDTAAADLALFPAGPTAAAGIRAQLAEVRVYILAQEGQRDDSYTTPTNAIFVGSPANAFFAGSPAVGRNVDVSSRRNYRWKTYSMVVKPMSLAQ